MNPTKKHFKICFLLAYFLCLFLKDYIILYILYNYAINSMGIKNFEMLQ